MLRRLKMAPEPHFAECEMVWPIIIIIMKMRGFGSLHLANTAPGSQRMDMFRFLSTNQGESLTS